MNEITVAFAAVSCIVACAVPIWHRRPPPSRLRPLGSGTGPPFPAAVGGVVRRTFRRPSGDAALDAQVGWALLSAAAGVVLFGAIGGCLAAVSWVVSIHRRRRRLRRAQDALTAELPDVIDLLSLGLRSGLTVRATIEVIVPHLTGEVADALAEAVDSAADGGSFADALSEIPGIDIRLRPLAGLLVSSLREGDSIVDGLDRLAADARADERRSHEERARRLPVTMLLPLVFGVLPAFVLLTIVPVVATGVVSLRLP